MISFAMTRGDVHEASLIDVEPHRSGTVDQVEQCKAKVPENNSYAAEVGSLKNILLSVSESSF